MARVGRYELLTKLSSGGMGEVFLARVAGAFGFAKLVAVKRIYPERSDSAKHRKLFVREAKLVAQLDHPNIVQVLELGVDGDDLFMAMEFVQGIDLFDLTLALRDSGQTLSTEQVLVLAGDVIAALEHAHAFIDEGNRITGIVHSDVSPHNIMVTVQGFAKLCDFGVAKILRRTHHETTLRGRWGKIAYMAPEQARDGSVDARTDVYALGVVLYESLSGTRMFDVSSAEQLFEAVIGGKAPSLASLRPDLPRPLVDAVQRACNVLPEHRFATVSELRNALQAASAAMDVTAVRRELADLVRRTRKPIENTIVQESRTAIVQHDDVAAMLAAPTTIFSLAHHAEIEPTRVTSVRRVLAAPHVALAALALLVVLTIALVKHARSRESDRVVQVTEPVALATPQPAQPVVASSPTVVAHDKPPSPMKKPMVKRAAPSSPPRDRDRDSKPQKTSTQPALLTLNAIPWAHVTIDGTAVKDTPLFDYPLPPGPHRVELRRPSGQRVELALNLRPGETVKKIVEFRPEP